MRSLPTSFPDQADIKYLNFFNEKSDTIDTTILQNQKMIINRRVKDDHFPQYTGNEYKQDYQREH